MGFLNKSSLFEKPSKILSLTSLIILSNTDFIPGIFNPKIIATLFEPSLGLNFALSL